MTGGSGFIGRHFLSRLYDLMGTGEVHFIQGVDIAHEFAPMDARDFFRTNNDHFDLVIHLAAVVGGRAKIEGAPLDLAVDLAIDAEMFGWAMRTKPGRIVYFSSSAAYPVNFQERGLTLPMKESYIKPDRMGTPDMTYGWAKLTGEMLARHASNAGLKVHVFRPFSGYGSDQDLDYPFPSFIDRALRHQDPFTIWGTGTQVRDFIHVDDIVEAVFAAIDQDVMGPVNLCSGRGVSFNELATMVCREAGYEPLLEHLDAPVGVHYRVGDPTEMLKFFTPRITLEEGIRQALEYAAAPA